MAALEGMLAAIKGETGQPGFHELMTKDSRQLVSENSSAANHES
jgi:hypothetical protein